MKRLFERAGAKRAWALVALLALTPSGCSQNESASLPEEDRLLEKVMETYVTERFRFYPVESTLAGLPGNDERLGHFSREAIEERIRWLNDFHHRLTGLRPTALSRPGYLDAMWLTSLVKAELFDLEERRLWRHTASFYGETLRLGLVSLLAASDLDERAGALAERLRAIPQLLTEARQNLEAAVELYRSDGLRSLEACRLLLQDLPEMLETRLPPHRVAELAELSRHGVRAIQELRDFIRVGQAGGEEHDFPLGAEGLALYLRYHHMIGRDVDALVAEAEAELARARGTLTEYALEEFPARPLATVLVPGALGSSPETFVEEAEGRVLAYSRKRVIAGVAEVPVRRVPDYFPGRAPVRLWRPRALEPEHGAFLMVQDVGGAGPSELERLVLREVLGRERQYAYQAGAGSLLRRVVASEITSEGWLSALEGALLADGYAPEDAKLRLRHYHARVVALVRTLAVLKLHAQGMTLRDAAVLFRERGYLTASQARAEAARAALDPSSASAGLGRILFQELDRDYHRAHPLASPRELEERLLLTGILPMRLLRFQILGAAGHALP